MRLASVVALLCAVALAPCAAGRQADGTLGLLVTPNNGIPAIVAPGDAFDAALMGRAELRLVAPEGEAPALDVAWCDLPGGGAKALCTVPEDAAPGLYALEAQSGDTLDRNVRAVRVLEVFPDMYVVAQLTDTHIGAQRNDASDAGTGNATLPVPPDSTQALRNAVDAVNASMADFAVVTGDLTDSGTPAQFREFLGILDGCRLPTFVTPGNHDRAELNFERVFGPTTYMFWFGRDGYLAFDTKDFITADGLVRQDADLEVFRRAIKPARWAIGFTHRYEPRMGMRCQLTLFADDPLDVLLFGHWHRTNSEAEPCVPWGRTPIAVMPATADGFVRFIDVSEKGIVPREAQRAAPPEQGVPTP